MNLKIYFFNINLQKNSKFLSSDSGINTRLFYLIIKIKFIRNLFKINQVLSEKNNK